jgi:serine/threonine-protein kinase PknK
MVPADADVRLGDYVADTCVAVGDVATVYRGRHAGVDFGIKVFTELDACKREVAVRSLLRGELLLCGAIGQRFAFVFPWREGATLDGDAKTTEREVFQLLFDVASQLEQLHALGIRHGDVKPANIVHAEGTYRLIDYSLADFFASEVRGGTPAYMPSDLARTGSADVYALGLTVQARFALDAEGSAPLARLIHAMVQERGRPSAAHVARCAARALGRVVPAVEPLVRVRLQYLRLRAVDVVPGAVYAFGGAPKAWLESAALLRHGLWAPEPREVSALPHLGKVRLLARFGLEGERRLRTLADDALVDEVVRCLLGARTVNRASASHAEVPAPTDLVRGMLEGTISDASLDEALQHTLPSSDLAGLACETWLGRGQLARASMIAPAAPVAMQADVARRQGNFARARTLAERVGDADRRFGLCARIAFDAGKIDEAVGFAIGADPMALEVRALCASTQESYARVKNELGEALFVARTHAEARRLWGALGYLEHRFSNSADGERAFAEAVRASRACGAALDEAVYLTGLASVQADLARGPQAIESAERALALWERLGEAHRAARVLLALASAHALGGNTEEAREAATLAGALAEQGADTQAALYARLARFDFGDKDVTLPDSQGLNAMDTLRIAARLWGPNELGASHNLDVTELDRQASAGLGVAAWEWWNARLAQASVEVHRAMLPRVEELMDRAPLSDVLPRMPALIAFAKEAGLLDQYVRLLRRQRAWCTLVQPYWGEARPTWLSVGEAADEPQLSEFAEIAALLQGQKSLREVVDSILDALVLWTGAERALLLTRIGDRLTIRRTRHFERRTLLPEQHAFSQSVAMRAMREGKPVLASNALNDAAHASVHALQLRSVLALPLILRGQNFGVVYLDHRSRIDAFGPSQVQWATLLASQAAASLSEVRDKLLLRRAIATAERAKRRIALELDDRSAELVATKSMLRRAARTARKDYSKIIGVSDAMETLLAMVDKVTDSDVPVLVLGESGTGKELVARAIHDNGLRSKHAFVSENCGAFPAGLLESTLFGHQKGAFTGAISSRRGMFEMANGGTLFLDEVAELSLESQVRLLRVLQDGEIWPLGAERAKRVDVRIVCATHRNLVDLVAKKLFREDLYYRLQVVSLVVPPLRERTVDVPALAQHFLTLHAGKRTVRITRSAMRALCAYGWPGNVRQLENEVRRALIASDGNEITLDDFSPAVVGAALPTLTMTRHAEGSSALRPQRDRLERELVAEALATAGGNKTRAAKALGVSRYGLRKMLHRLGLANPDTQH